MVRNLIRMSSSPLSASLPTAASVGKENWSALRAGILLGGAYKLVERVPRWVARRRFRARPLDGSDEVALLFFSLSDADLARWQKECRALAPFSDPNLYPVSRVEQFQEFRFVVGDWVAGEDLEMFLMENGPLDPSQARPIFQSLLASVRRLFFAGLPVPPLAPSQILLSRAPSGPVPLLFPLAESPKDVLETEAVICRGLRDLLFSLLTGLEARPVYDERVLQLLPRSVSAVWEPVFLEDPNFDLLKEHVEMALPLRPAPPLQPPPPRVPRNLPDLEEEADEVPVRRRKRPPSHSGMAGMELPVRRRPLRQVPPPRHTFRNLFALGLALLVPILLGWMAWHFIFERESPEPRPLSLKDIDAGVGLPSIPAALPEQSPTAPQSAVLPDETARPHISASANSPRALVGGNQIPAALPRDPLERLRVIAQEIQQDSQSAYLQRELDELLQDLTRRENDLRAGRNEALLAGIEETQAAHPDIALLFARILWGRDTPQAEAIYVRLAREGNATAREICRQRMLQWQTNP